MEEEKTLAAPAKKPHFILRSLSVAFKFAKGYFIAIGLFVTVLPMILAFILRDAGENIKLQKNLSDDFSPFDKIVLDFKLDDRMGEKSENPTNKFFKKLLGQKGGIKLSTLTNALRRAKEDIRVQAVFVELGPLSANRANITELRRAFQDFKDSKKTLHFHVTNPDTNLYYLASIADTITISPTDQLMLPGPVFQLTYYAEALKKLGIEFEVVRAGKYKSAMESLVASEPSQETLEMYHAMEASLIQHFVDHVSVSRGRTAGEVRNWLKKSFFTANEAKEIGIIDQISYLADTRKAFKKQFEAAKLVTPLAFMKGSNDLDEPLQAYGSDKIGYIEAFGTIVSFAPTDASNPVITPKSMKQQIEYMMENDNIKAVVMRIDSPGGSATASDEIWGAVKQMAAKKPLIVSMGGVAASGGYYIAAPAKKVFADPTTITGSIGVISGIPKAAAFREKWGLSFHVISGSERKNVFDFGGKLTNEDRLVLSSMVEEFYQTFLSRVAEGRGKTVEDIHLLAQGRVYTGSEALGIGLIDHLGGLKESFQMAKKLGGLDEDKLYEVARYQPRPKSAMDCIGLETSELIECFERLESWVPDISHHLRRSPLDELGLKGARELMRVMSTERTLAIWPGAFSRGAQCYQLN